MEEKACYEFLRHLRDRIFVHTIKAYRQESRRFSGSSAPAPGNRSITSAFAAFFPLLYERASAKRPSPALARAFALPCWRASVVEQNPAALVATPKLQKLHGFRRWKKSTAYSTRSSETAAFAERDLLLLESLRLGIRNSELTGINIEHRYSRNAS